MILLCLYSFATRTEFRFIYHLHFLNISLFLCPRCVCVICALDTRLPVATRSEFLVIEPLFEWQLPVALFARQLQVFRPFSCLVLGGHTLHKVWRFQLQFPVQFSALIFFFLCHFPFSIFYFLLQAFLCVFVALFGAFEMQFPKKYSPSRVSKYATTDCADCADSFLEEVEVFMSPNSVWQSVKAVRTVNTHFE